MTFYILLVIEHSSRRVYVAGATTKSAIRSSNAGLFFRVAQTASLDGYPELELRNCDKVVFLVQGRIKHQVYSGRYPDVVSERYSPVRF